MRLRLFHRYALIIGSLLLAIVTVLCGFFLYTAHEANKEIIQTSNDLLSAALKAEAQKRGKSLVLQLKSTLIPAVHNYDMETLYFLLKPVRKDPDIDYVLVVDSEGRILHDGSKTLKRYGEKLGSKAVGWALDHHDIGREFINGRLVMAGPIMLDNNLLGALVLGLNLHDLKARSKDMSVRLNNLTDNHYKGFLLNTLIATLVISVLAILVSLAVARNMARPVKRFSAMAKKVGRGEYDLPINVSRKDEIGDLANSFRQMTRQLKETTISKEFFRNVIDSMADALFVLNDDYTIAMVNRAFSRLTGYEGETLEGRNCSDFFPHSKGRLPDWRQIPMQKGHALVGRESAIKDRKGNNIPVRISATLMPGDIGKPDRIICLATNLAELKEAQEEKQALQKQLNHSQRLQAVGNLVAGISHDFNNLLQVLRGYLFMISQSGDTTETQEQYVIQAEGAISRATDLVKRLLTFSRKLEPEPCLLDLNHMVRQATRFIQHALPPMIKIDTDLTPHLNSLWADAQQLESVILNLVTNARDAMPDGGNLLIRTRNVGSGEPREGYLVSCPPGNYVQLSVEDNGQGIEPEVAEHIFEPYFSTKKRGEGTGLGLSAVYGIIRSHKGRIDVSSAPGKGARFDIFLPAELRKTDGRDEHSDSKDNTVVAASARIMVVDDEETIRTTTARFMEIQGHHAITAESGEKALELFAESDKPVDLVLLDLGMPGMGGQACMHELLRLDSAVRIIIVSGYTGQDTAQGLLEAGARAVLKKPFQFKELTNTINQVLNCREYEHLSSYN